MKMMKLQSPKLLVVVLTSTLLLTVHGAILKTVDFSNSPIGKHDPHDSIGGTLWYQSEEEDQSFIIEDSATGNRYWRTKFPRHCAGHVCGAQLLTSQPVLKDRLNLWFSQNFRVDDNFDFVRGGILPGICGGACDTTCTNVPGDNKGWSARLHFDGAGNMNVNIFDMNRKKDECGRYPNLKNSGNRIKIQKGKWHFVEMRVKLNTSNNPPNGKLQVYVDGKQGLSISNIKWRNNLNANPIEAFYANMYLFNGEKHLEHESNMFFDDFTFSTARLTPPTPHPVNQPSRAPTQSPTKLPTETPTTVDDLTTISPTEQSTTTDSPTSTESNTDGSGGVDDTTIAAIGSFLFVMGIALFGISRRYRKDQYPEYDPDVPPGLRLSVARRVQSFFKSTTTPRNKRTVFATTPGTLGGKKPSKVKLLAPGSSNMLNSSFSSLNPKYTAESFDPNMSARSFDPNMSARSFDPMIRAGSFDVAWQLVGNPADGFKCQCDDRSAGLVAISNLKRSALEILAKHLGIGFQKSTTTPELLQRVSDDPRLSKDATTEPGELNHGRISVCRSCLRSQSPDV